MIYQSQKKFQAQLNYRGKIYTVSNGESIPSLGKVVHIDDKQVVMKRENKILSYPAPGTDRQDALRLVRKILNEVRYNERYIKICSL